MKSTINYSLLFLLLISNLIFAQQKDESDKIYVETVEFSKEELKANKSMIFSDNSPKGVGTKTFIDLLIPSTIDFAVNQISTALKKRAEKFIGKYNTKYIGDNFYEVDTAGAKLKIKHFLIIRESTQQRNSEIVLKPVLSTDGAFFRLEVSKVNIKKGRTNKIKNKIDIELNIAFISKNLKDDDYEDNTTNNLKILVEGLHLGKEFTDLKNASTQWIEVPKLSKKGGTILGGGTFELLVDVTETDSFKDRAKAISTKYDENKKTIGDILKDLFDKKDK